VAGLVPPLLISSTEIGFPPSASGWPFHASNRTAILEVNPDREVVAIDVERDIDILRVQVWTSRIVKAPNLATGQDEAANSVPIAPSAFEPIPQVDCTEFVFVGSHQPVVAHSDKRDLIGRT
jgi:hypothetical protein